MSIAIKNRLRRISGQLEKLEKTIESETACSDVIPQFLAIKGAVNAAFLTYIQTSLAECSKSDTETVEELVKYLVKS